KVTTEVCAFALDDSSLIPFCPFLLLQSIVNDLHHGERNVLAIGMVNDKLTVFVSDVDHRFDLVGGYRLEVYPSDGGRLQVSSHPMPLPSEVPSGSVNFVCTDSNGAELVVMNYLSVQRLSLALGTSFTLNMNNTVISNCFCDGSLHVSSSSLRHYYVITFDGKVTLDGFVGDPIASSKQCLDPAPLGLLCFFSTTVTMTKDNCSGTFPKDLTAGYIDYRGVYLFDESNTAYVFSRKVLDSPGYFADLFQFDGGQIFHVVKTTPKFAPCKMKYGEYCAHC
ncbi:MAG: hypothetical protein QWI73_06870, partial [Alphaproteobacteria bacterium]|nr:hypothetical protein [Alphaproteobacteria bacterium]